MGAAPAKKQPGSSDDSSRRDKAERLHGKQQTLKERREGHMKDALALGGEEGRDKLR